MTPDADTWSRLLDDLEPPTFGELAPAAEEYVDGVDDGAAAVEAALAGGELVEEGDGMFPEIRVGEARDRPDTGESDPEEPGSADDTPTPEPGETAPQDREAAVEALRDVLRFYNDRVDDGIPDHTDAGEHPERPTTAREYFTDRRGWDSETVDDLLLGWAPPDHVDELIAWLHDRGHSREAILATGAVGVSDSGGFYTTFAGRYVLPYYDDDGEPAYAIARATGGDGGGAKGYGGHPRDYQAGKYAKLRHTDDRVPFDEPIYGLDTLDAGDQVVIAEGIADAITARELGYAVLSPVAKEFKEKHYAPLAAALEANGVERVTIVADADGIRNRDAEDATPESIREAVGVSLSPVGAGLAGALRTADKLGDRADVDVRVTVPPAPADLESDLDEYVTGAWAGDLAALLRSARPPTAFDEYDTVAADTTVADRYDDFDADEYEPTATTAEDTTDDVRDLFAAVDRLDARRVADRTIVSEWLEDSGDRRTFAPTWAPAGYSGTANFVDRDKWVDTGGRGGRGGPVVMAAIDAGLVRDTECPGAVRGKTWWRAVDHLRELGFSIPEYADDEDSDGGEEYRTDPRELDATVDPRRAWSAAARVIPRDVDDDRLTAAATGDGFACPDCDEELDVVRAVAVREGLLGACDATIDDEYPEAYRLAREEYGAPLPRYYTTADAIAEFDALLDVIAEVEFFHLDEEALASVITARGDEVGGDAVQALDPAWRESESGESVLVFESGTAWDAKTERVLDALRFVALDSGLLASPWDTLEGADFTEAYRRAREEYGAPLPRWEPAADGAREVTPQLPPAEDLVDARDLDGVHDDAIGGAREEVEALIGGAVRDAEEPTVVTALPALGKTTGTVKTARERPLSYLAPRKELQAQALDKADTWGVDAEVLPVFSEEQIRDEVLNRAVSHVRERGKDRLRDRWSVLAAALDVDEEEEDVADTGTDIFAEEDEDDDVDLQRATCPTAEGEHGEAWALAVHVARRLGYYPSEIHGEARGLFGAPLPCEGDHDEGDDCPYSAAWGSVSDPDAPADLLVGSYVHAKVPSVRTAYSRAADGTRETAPRAIVLDEYPGDAFTKEFGEEALDFAAWLARALRDDVDDRRDMVRADLWGDEWVRAWLDGDGDGDEDVADAVGSLARKGDLLDARRAAAEIRDEVDSGVLDTLGLGEPLRRFLEGDDDAREAFDRLGDAVVVDPERPGAGVARWVEDAVVDELATATEHGASSPDTDGVDVEELPIAGSLRGLVEDTIEGVRAGEDGARDMLRAATTALTGGRDGCRRLAAWADDGYAHPDAHHFLQAVATPTDGDSVPLGASRVYTSEWAFDPDATDGTVLDVVETGGRATALVDRNDHGAVLHTPPGRTDAGGEDVPVVGLDATGRAELWRVALGEGVTTADIHDTPAERARFLEEALNLRVLQAADRPRYYEGDPASKDTDGDVALLEALADEYAGIDAPRKRGDAATSVGKPAAITTKGVREVLENDGRLDDVVAAWENYGNVTGSNDLGSHRLAAVLGCQHYGDAAIERLAALDGDEVDTDRARGRGADLEYGSDVANAYLKHMTEDQTMQAILRFARGDSGATVVARTSTLREDLPVVGRAQVVDTWSETATRIARRWRQLGREFTAADVADVVDVSARQVRRVLAELVEAGYLQRADGGPGLANVYERVEEPGAGEVELPERREAVASGDNPGRSGVEQYYTWNVRVVGEDRGIEPPGAPPTRRARGGPPAPGAVGGVGPPG